MSEQAPFTRTYEENVPAVTILATTVTQICEILEAGVVSRVDYKPAANITGADSPASRTISIINKGQDGNGAVVVATLAFTLAVNGLDFDEIAFTLSATPANLVVAEGDVLVASSAPVGGTGLVDPGGRIKVTTGRS